MSLPLAADLARLLGAGKVGSVLAEREAHGRDESTLPPALPDVVAYAASLADVQAVLRYASENSIPVIPFGAGTSLSGQVLAPFGGISLDLSRMDSILEIRPEDPLAVVQPGVTRNRLNLALRPHGLWMPVDPGAKPTLGGMAATNSSGTNAVRYGTMRDQVLALEAVLASGEALRVGTRARKSSNGYHLAGLLVGSEGTLGVITELTLRLHPLPAVVLGARVRFPSDEAALAAGITLVQAGVDLARLELLDQGALRAVNAVEEGGLPEAATLFLEFHGSEAAVRAEAALAAEVCADHEGSPFESATDDAGRSALWEARSRAYWALPALHPTWPFYSTDVAVPLSRLAESVAHAQAARHAARLPGHLMAHVADGAYHMLFVADPDATTRAEAVNEAVARKSIELGGTVSGEHGIGLRKRALLGAEQGTAMEAMGALKQALDPKGILNPGKLVDGVGARPARG